MSAKACAGSWQIVLCQGETEIVAVPNPYPMRSTPKHVLQEDDYTEAISALIERDFFPDLPHLRLRQELFQAKRSGDDVRMRDILSVLSQLPRPTPTSTPVHRPLEIAWGATPRLPAHGETPRIPRAPADGQFIGGVASAWEQDDGADSVVTGPSLKELAGSVHLKLQSGKEVPGIRNTRACAH
eukprot:5869905-Amphidinium_carterae.1